MDPADGSQEWARDIGTGSSAFLICPAVGPIANDFSDRNFVYAPKFNGGDPEFYAVFSDNGATPYTAEIDTFTGLIQSGTFASATVHENGDIVVGSDDGGLYAFAPEGTGNVLDTRATYDFNSYISATAAVTPGREVIFWTESPTLRRVLDSGTALTPSGGEGFALGKNWEGGAPSADSADRIYVNTIGSCGSDDGRKVFGLMNDSSVSRIWTYVPPGDCECVDSDPCDEEDECPRVLQQEFEAPIAIDFDGTLICVNRGYILALRPLLGDLDGDGDVDCDDMEAFVTALVFPATWESTIGAPLGVNMVGVGDCNNDGVVNNFDIDCMEATICMYCECGEGFGRGENMSPAEVFAILRDMFD